MSFIVSKFGGWANASAERLKKAADLFESNPERRIKVNSAIGKIEGLPKVTDLLIEGANKRIKTGTFPDEIKKFIHDNHYKVFEPLDIPKSRINEIMDLLDLYIDQYEKYTPDYFRALIIGTGEELFSRLDTLYLTEIRKLNARYVDPREIGHYLQGHPLDGKIHDMSYENLANLRNYQQIVVYPGFFGVDVKSRPMIYSRGGTDKTAADIAKATHATIYENWKDVDGIYAADPRIVDHPSLISEVTYKEIRELSYISFDVLHQEAMIPVMKASIPINIKNLLKPSENGTFIVNSRQLDHHYPVVGVAHISDVCFINVEKTLMNEEIGFADSILTIFREHKVSIDQITTGIDTMCLVVATDQFEEKTIHTGITEGYRKKINIDEFAQYLKSWLNADSVQIRKNKTLICVVGEGMIHTVGLLNRITKALTENNVNIELLDQGPSERNVIIGIDSGKKNENAFKAVNAIYHEFLNNYENRKKNNG
ncbi:MAG: aspartate kinase [Spirochaetes bacterium]|nr:aspartate kinase [Spirochaetota bacterium]